MSPAMVAAAPLTASMVSASPVNARRGEKRTSMPALCNILRCGLCVSSTTSEVITTIGIQVLSSPCLFLKEGSLMSKNVLFALFKTAQPVSFLTREMALAA